MERKCCCPDWLPRLAVVAACALVAVATWFPLAKNELVGEMVALPALAAWSALGARWVLAVAAVLGLVGRRDAALALCGLATGLVLAPFMAALRDAFDLLAMQRESDPGLVVPDPMLRPQAGAWCLAAGVLLWLVLPWIRRKKAAQTS